MHDLIPTVLNNDRHSEVAAKRPSKDERPQISGLPEIGIIISAQVGYSRLAMPSPFEARGACHRAGQRPDPLARAPYKGDGGK
jgi:hypothetical protein